MSLNYCYSSIIKSSHSKKKLKNVNNKKKKKDFNNEFDFLNMLDFEINQSEKKNMYEFMHEINNDLSIEKYNEKKIKGLTVTSTKYKTLRCDEKKIKKEVKFFTNFLALNFIHHYTQTFKIKNFFFFPINSIPFFLKKKNKRFTDFTDQIKDEKMLIKKNFTEKLNTESLNLNSFNHNVSNENLFIHKKKNTIFESNFNFTYITNFNFLISLKVIYSIDMVQFQYIYFFPVTYSHQKTLIKKNKVKNIAKNKIDFIIESSLKTFSDISSKDIIYLKELFQKKSESYSIFEKNTKFILGKNLDKSENEKDLNYSKVEKIEKNLSKFKSLTRIKSFFENISFKQTNFFSNILIRNKKFLDNSNLNYRQNLIDIPIKDFTKILSCILNLIVNKNDNCIYDNIEFYNYNNNYQTILCNNENKCKKNYLNNVLESNKNSMNDINLIKDKNATSSNLYNFLINLFDKDEKHNETKLNNIISFYGSSIPNVTLETYLHRIIKYCPLSSNVFLSLLIYFDRIILKNTFEKKKNSFYTSFFFFNSQNIHRFIISGIVVSSKFYSDFYYKNLRYAKVGGLSLKELNNLELNFLMLLDFELFIHFKELQYYNDLLIHFWSINKESIF